MSILHPPIVQSPTFSHEQNYAIYVAPLVLGSFSIAGSFLVVYWFLRMEKKQRNTYHRILFFMCCMDLMGSIAYFLGQIPILYWEVAPGFCIYQAFFIQLNSAVYYWNGILATNFMLRIVYEYKEHDTEKLEKYYHAVAWTAPVITAFVALGLEMYGPAGPWCWIQQANEHGNWDWARWAFYYAGLWTVMLYSFSCMARIVNKVARTEKSIAGNVSKGGPSKRAKQARTQALLYIAAFLTTWVPGTANRIQNAANPGHPVFALVFLQAMLVPGQGFFNFLVYIHPRYASWGRASDETGFVGVFKWLFRVCCYREDEKNVRPDYKSADGASRKRTTNPNEKGTSLQKTSINGGNEGTEAGESTTAKDGEPTRPTSYDARNGKPLPTIVSGKMFTAQGDLAGDDSLVHDSAEAGGEGQNQASLDEKKLRQNLLSQSSSGTGAAWTTTNEGPENPERANTDDKKDDSKELDENQLTIV